MRVGKGSLKSVLLLVFILFILFIPIKKNIWIEHKVYADYINIRLEITDYSSAKMVGSTIYFKAEPGAVVQGTTTLTNKEPKTRDILIYLEGDLAEREWLSVSETSFSLNKDEKKSIEVAVNPSFDAKGNYTGRLRIENW